jgi:hypothetical protein
VIAGENFHPADILEKLAEETYRMARSDSDQRFLEEAEENATSSYPAPIALAFNSFLHGATSALARLGFMRDTWEAVVNVCYAVVLSECVHNNISLRDVIMRDGPNNNPRAMAKRDLRSDSIAVRLGCIEGTLVYMQHAGLNAHAATIVPIELIGEMRRLNDVRNGFSHEQTKSEQQAKKIIEDCKDDLLEVLADLNGLTEIDLFRFHGIATDQPNTLKVEMLNGCSARRITSLSLNTTDIATCTSIASPGDFDPVFVSCRGSIYPACPYLYCQHDETGHQTRVLMLKRIMASEAIAKFEASGLSVSVDFDLPRVQPAIDNVEALLGP